MKRPLVLLSLCLLAVASHAWAIEKRSPRKECTICHVRWLESYGTSEKILLERKETTIIVSGSMDVVTTREMCMSCHDGYVTDSRMRLAKGNKHHDLKKPPQGLVLPENFRLDMHNELYCGTCHGFHDIKAEGKIGEVPFLRLPNDRSQMCLACHKENGEEQKLKNHLILVKLKNPPSPQLIAEGARFGPDKELLCQSCHAAHAKEVSLATVEDSKLCLCCHADKLDNAVPPEKGWQLHSVNIKPDKDGQRFAHVPVQVKLGADGKLTCSTCHSVHKGRSPSQLVLEDSSTLCDTCHQDKVEVLSGTKHDLLKTAPTTHNLLGEPPGKSGMCRTCHLAHGWAQRIPEGCDPISGACLSCHRQEGWAAKKQIGHYSHPVDVVLASDKLKTDLPLQHQNNERRVECSSCHDPHKYWPIQEKRTQPIEVQGDPTNSFLRMEGPRLCAQCHPDKGLLQDTKHDLMRFDKPLDREFRELITLGGPCMGCHRIHNAGAEMIWFKPLPGAASAFDRDEATRRCMSCHSDKTMTRIDRTQGHHVGEAIKAVYLPKPADALKLGEPAVPGQETRVILCTTCHIPHAARNMDGRITLFAGSGLPKQELCVTCHEKNRGVISSPHDFRMRQTGQYLPDQGRSHQAGVCAGCHANHTSTIERKLLWFEIPSPKGKGNPEDMVCLFCHNNPRIMGEKRIKFYAHPSGTDIQQTVAEKIKIGEISPVEEIRGLEGVRFFGYTSIFCIRCVTCHDNHQWMARPAGLNGTPLDPTEMTSFLRGSIVAEKLCSKCHGLEALYRYRFFHQERMFKRKIVNE